MLFSSLTFLCWFLPAVVLLHLIAPFRIKNALLFFASVFFYAWGEIRYVPLVLGSMLVNCGLGYLCASDKNAVRRASLIASLVFNFGALAFFKYAGFLMRTVGLSALAPDIALPLGISFYTFQTQAYVIDVYRKRFPPEKSFVDYATFILLFPQLIAGPIVLYADVSKELKSRVVTADGLESGMAVFIAGLSSKVLLANPLGALWRDVQALPSASMPASWLGIIAFGLQIYFDFAGYSLMAIGMGRMFGFRFPENFRHPYASRSIREFWRRWHMTLGGWFREYVYLPLGGSRGGALKTIRNLLIVWSLTGLWHGASWNFVAWGLWFCLFLLLERFVIGDWLERHRRAALLYTLFTVFVGWALFAHDNLSEAGAYMARLFSFSFSVDFLFPLRNNAVLLVLAALCCAPPFVGRLRRLLRGSAPLRVPLMVAALLLCVAGLVNAGYNPFLYFRF